MANDMQHWPRWIKASLSEHFDNASGSVVLFVEAMFREEQDEQELVELRVDGPYLTELSKGYWKVFCEVSLMLQTAMNDDLYREDRIVGTMTKACSAGIQVFRYGPDAVDDNSSLGCFHVVSDARGKERIQVNRFGQIKPSVRLLQSTVEMHLTMEITV